MPRITKDNILKGSAIIDLLQDESEASHKLEVARSRTELRKGFEDDEERRRETTRAGGHEKRRLTVDSKGRRK
jgi:hypothetical protein